MSTTPTPATFAAELPSRAEIARIVKDAERMRAEASAELLRSAGRGIVRLGRAAGRAAVALPRRFSEQPRPGAA